MYILVSGGAASGKSEYAESLVLTCAARPRLYVATMEVWDDESRARVARHRAMRRDKGFQTIEAPRRLFEAALPTGGAENIHSPRRRDSRCGWSRPKGKSVS